MSTRKQDKAVQNLQQIWQLSKTNPKQQMQWLLRGLLVIGRQERLSETGFVLPTVAMVSLVIVLLTTAMMFRAFDQSKYASNVRVNQAVLNAATPALDRARAKIDALFADPALPRSTPSDSVLYNALASKTAISDKYKLGDETRLKIAYDIDGDGTIEKNTVLEYDETLNTAWKFPVDTDNNGKFDSYTLYSILLRSPSRNDGGEGQFNRARNPLEARTPPMEGGKVGTNCANAAGTSASLVGDSDWYKSGAKLTKSFFVYTATVPITILPPSPTVGAATAAEVNAVYETHKGNKGFSALEFQQDRGRIPLNNNAAWYEDDIEVSYGTIVRLNGRIFTNSNLMVGGNPNSSARTMFYQVSDPKSCYYEQENSKIIIGGNIANADVAETTDLGLVEVHSFQGKAEAPDGQDDTSKGVSSTNKTTNKTGGSLVGYNNRAYSERVGLMVEAAISLHGVAEPDIGSVSGVARYPQDVKIRFSQRFNNPNDKEPKKILREELETYFKARTRRVPYAEISTGSALSGLTTATVLGSTSPIRPPDTWMAIESPANSASGYTNLTLNFPSNNLMNLKATEPKQQEELGKENFIGDRIIVGNNLPSLWPIFNTSGVFDRFANPGEQQVVKNGTNNVFWSNPDSSTSSVQRTRQSQLQILPDLGSIERDGFWETEAAKKPAGYENSGGLRVITGTGIYIDGVITTLGGIGIRKADPLAAIPLNLLSVKSFLPIPSINAGINATDIPKFTTATITTGNDNIIVWSDSMPMTGGFGQTEKGDLQMRATAVYHYTQGSTVTTGVDPNQVPIACVSSYYDPTNVITAKNKVIDGGYGVEAVNGKSDNGVTYNAPYTSAALRTSAITTYRTKLDRQARLIFPTGRIVNQPLRNALINIDATKDRSLADNAAIDTAICALKIMDGTLIVQPSPNVPHKAIKEATFLDARQVKSLNNDIKPDGTTLDNTKIAEIKTKFKDSYTLPLEQRQPLEIRVTELDMNLLKTTAIGTPTNSNNDDPGNNQEYLLPNSGIIYATREDALPDESDDNADPNTRLSVSAADFKLDSTRRPNGIRLVNGSNIARKDFFRVAEKGLILATNLPSYIKGNFNLHKDPASDTVREEFEEDLAADWTNFYERGDTDLDGNFACRKDQPDCVGSGDQWRPATIISDSQTLLSIDFKDGFRDLGDYDLNNNQGNSAAENRLKYGFWNNSFVTNAVYWDTGATNGFPTATAKNSYVTNGVTPVQRRGRFSEYLMEVCVKLPVDTCGPTDWYINPATTTGVSSLSADGTETFSTGTHKAGTTAQNAHSDYSRYARRVAFRRNVSGQLQYVDDDPVPLGINGSGKIQRYPYTTGALPRLANNALWFKTTDSDTNSTIDTQFGFDEDSLFVKQRPAASSTDQPQLVPVLQIHYPTGTPQDWNPNSFYTSQDNNWMQQADTTTANVAFITGDSPARSSISGSTSSERGGGLQNFVRFLERWSGETARISGSFIQYKRSSYASAPFFPVDPTAAIQASSGLFYTLDGSNQALYLFGYGVRGFRYRTNIVEYRASFYVPPNRAFGFDVALLSQSPDLFAQRFTTNPTSPPSEFFREVGRDDDWVQTLLCAAEGSGSIYDYSVRSDRPSNCPAIASYND